MSAIDKAAIVAACDPYAHHREADGLDAFGLPTPATVEVRIAHRPTPLGERILAALGERQAKTAAALAREITDVTRAAIDAEIVDLRFGHWVTDRHYGGAAVSWGRVDDWSRRVWAAQARYSAMRRSFGIEEDEPLALLTLPPDRQAILVGLLREIDAI